MAYLQSNIPYFKAWVRREYTKNMQEYHGEFLHCMVIAVTSMPNRTLSFQVIFTGCESDDEDEPNVHGGAMWARMPLTFTEKKYKPRFIIDLATLTGAIIVSLGSEYAGLFSNNDKLSNELIDAGEKVNEKLWRMPLHKNYDKLINSKNADMQNINYVGGAGSTTAAQFLQRFILNKTPWAHLDIAGMAFSKYGGALNSGGATGYGVRLLNQLVEDNYE